MIPMNKDVEILLGEKKHDFFSLVRIMALLRAEDGCPWDREQTHESIRANMIEETYEVIEAIDNNDPVLLREELGDALLQIVFHARISEEAGEFNVEDVIHDICAKLIHRHPHIFGNVQADTSEQVLSNWEAIKTEEKQRIGLSGTLNSIPPALPALMRAQKMVKKSVKEGIAPAESDLYAGVADSLESMKVAAETGNASQKEQSMARILWQLCAIAQTSGMDAEKLLCDQCLRYARDVENTEKQSPDGCTLPENEKKRLSERNFL